MLFNQHKQNEHHAPQMFAEIEITGDAETKKSLPIPPRGSASGGTGIVHYPQADTAIRTGAEVFVDQAKRLAGKTAVTAAFVPFMAYWPTYSSMTAAQSQWYFYWRGKVREGEYPATDLSYIFLYVYELINMVGCKSTQEGYRRLVELRRAYGTAYPKLKTYLNDWIHDFALIYQLDEEAETEYAGLDAGGRDLDRLLLDKFTERPLNMDVGLLSQTANYDITRSKFYQSLNAQICEDYIPVAVALVDAYLEKQKGRRIIDMFRPDVVRRERYLFRSALYAGSQRTVQVDTVPVSAYPPLRDFLTQVIRHTENKLREIRGYQGRLRGVELEDELKRLIDAYLDRELVKKPEPPQGIVIDTDKLKRAAREAEQTQRMLSADRPEPQAEDKPEQMKIASVPVTEFAAEPKQNQPADIPAKLLFLSLDENETRLIRAFCENGWEADTRRLQRAVPDCMVEEVIDKLNEKSLKTLGGLLVVQENGLYLIDEDYREELSFLQTQQSQPGNQIEQHEEPEASGQDSGWLDLFRSLTTHELEMLKALTLGAGQQTLQHIAERAGTLLEPMLDGINEKAMTLIDDIIIEGSAITDEYKPDAAALFLQKDE